MTKSEAIKDSIAHWKRMIKWVKTQNPKTITSPTLMNYRIKQDWIDLYCSLCKKYYNDIDECLKCPLAIKYKPCSEKYSSWRMVEMSINWEEWLINAKIMVKQLKSLL